MDNKSDRNKEIVRLRDNGDTFKSIALKFDLSPVRIAQIVRREERRCKNDI